MSDSSLKIIETLQTRIAELEAAMVTMHNFEDARTIERLDAALAEIQHTPHLSSVEYNQMAAKARAGK